MPFPPKQNYRNSFLLGKACVTAVRKFIPRSGNLPGSTKADNYKIGKIRGYRFASSKYTYYEYNKFKSYYEYLVMSQPPKIQNLFHKISDLARINYITSAIKDHLGEHTPSEELLKKNWEILSPAEMYSEIDKLTKQRRGPFIQACLIKDSIVAKIKSKLKISDDEVAKQILKATSEENACKLLALNVAAKEMLDREISIFREEKINDMLSKENNGVFGMKKVSAKHNLNLVNPLSSDIHCVYKAFKNKTGNCDELTWACVFGLKCLPCRINGCLKPYIYTIVWKPDHLNLLISSDNTLHYQDWTCKKLATLLNSGGTVVLEPWWKESTIKNRIQFDCLKQEMGRCMEYVEKLNYVGRVGEGFYVKSSFLSEIQPYLESVTKEIRSFYNYFNRINFPRQRRTWL